MTFSLIISYLSFFQLLKCVTAEDIPIFALEDDRIVEVLGEPVGVHKAIELIASHLRKFLVDRSVIPLFEMQVSFSVSINSSI